MQDVKGRDIGRRQRGAHDGNAIGQGMDAGRRFVAADDIVAGFVAEPARLAEQRVGKIARHLGKIAAAPQAVGGDSDCGLGCQLDTQTFARFKKPGAEPSRHEFASAGLD